MKTNFLSWQFRMQRQTVKQFGVFLLFAFTALFFLQSCSVVRPGETALKTRWGKYKDGTLTQGLHVYNPIGTKVIKYSLRITEYSEKMHLPTKEGLEINTALTLLYHLKPGSEQSVYSKFGNDYASPLILNNLYAIARQSTISYYANDIITQRETMEKEITESLVANVSPYGIVIDKVLLKDIILPSDITQAIANKVSAQQVAQKAEFDVQKQRVELNFSIEKQLKEAQLTVDKQKIEAERLQIEAESIKKAQIIINESLTDKVLKYKSLEITKGLITSPNAKVIISNGNTPFLLNTGNQ
ncbi:MAG: prohibitin family protein [Sphingobacteriales bacterium]|nr:prohibitin family protein [Sphingobacteriales bacterium]MBI3718590.1 prohibitin family protein [Sphingobacteriales bacterium]